MNEVWQKIVEESLNEGVQISRGAVPGAKFRQIIARVAPKYDQQYPPEGHEDEKFGQFLNGFGSLLVILRRDGQDILVAPVDKPQLLGSQHIGQAQIRDDIFEAFTQIPRGTPPLEPWYERDTDRIEWSPENQPLDSERYVKIPPATLSQELEDRRAFAASAGVDAGTQENIVATLQEHSALWAFSKIVKDQGLSRKWHLFRFQLVVRRIRGWCEKQHIEWREDWLRSRAELPVSVKTGKAATVAAQGRLFERFVEALGDEDLKRVSVPLDIVLKLLKK